MKELVTGEYNYYQQLFMRFFKLVLFVAIFLNTSISNLVGVELITTAAFAPILSLILLSSYANNINYFTEKNKVFVFAAVIAFIYLVLQYFNGENYLKNLLTFLFLPIVFTLFFDKLTRKYTLQIRNVVLIFFIIECFLAVIERVFSFNAFEFIEFANLTDTELYMREGWQFRSTALLGHPLANAMVVVTISSFIIVSDIKNSYKLLLFFLGYAALFSFNARGAIIVYTLIVLPYFIYILFRNTKFRRERIKMVVALILFIIVFVLLLVNTEFGGRMIFSDKPIIDGSAMTRLDVFEFYKHVSTFDLLFGNPNSYLNVMKALGAGGVENGIITIILLYGLVFGLFLLYVLFKLQIKGLRTYNNYNKWFLILVFYSVGIMNPNLSMFTQWVFFIFCIFSFKFRANYK